MVCIAHPASQFNQSGKNIHLPFCFYPSNTFCAFAQNGLHSNDSNNVRMFSQGNRITALLRNDIEVVLQCIVE